MRWRRAATATAVVAVLVGALFVFGPLIPPVQPDTVVTADDCAREWNAAPPVEAINADIVFVQPYDGWDRALQPAECRMEWADSDDESLNIWVSISEFEGSETESTDGLEWEQRPPFGDPEPLDGVHAAPRAENHLAVTGNLDWKENSGQGSD